MATERSGRQDPGHAVRDPQRDALLDEGDPDRPFEAIRASARWPEVVAAASAALARLNTPPPGETPRDR
ncbi:MAG TPA: hypothetical protein VF045_02160 [Acidimicrobiales bacterium]